MENCTSNGVNDGRRRLAGAAADRGSRRRVRGPRAATGPGNRLDRTRRQRGGRRAAHPHPARTAHPTGPRTGHTQRGRRAPHRHRPARPARADRRHRRARPEGARGRHGLPLPDGGESPAADPCGQRRAHPTHARDVDSGRSRQALLGVPLLGRDQVLGVLFVLERRPRRFTGEDINAIASHRPQ
ncbi:GAF domain-containing protein [Pseudonocardia xinjiangensis]|uniref:GAF domain-containing protein n=1 Tax=Pseudonocardia xinjiangensis TaxID=75289 RepID=UPI003899FDD1